MYCQTWEMISLFILVFKHVMISGSHARVNIVKDNSCGYLAAVECRHTTVLELYDTFSLSCHEKESPARHCVYAYNIN